MRNKTKPKEILTLKVLLDVCDKLEMGVTRAHIARSLGISPTVLWQYLKKSGLYVYKNKTRPRPLGNGWLPVATAPKDRTILGWVEKPAKMVSGQINRGYYCTVSWFDGRWDDGIEYHDIFAWQELPEPPL